MQLALFNASSLLLVLFTVMGCASGDASHDDVENHWSAADSLTYDEHDIIHLSGEVLHASDRLGVPIALAAVGSHIIVGDASSGPPLHVIKRTSGRYVGALSREGEGPGEFASVSRILPAGESEFWVWDASLRRLTLIDLQAYLEGENRSRGIPEWHLRQYVVEAEGYPVDVALRSDSTSIATGLFPEGRLAQFSPSGALLSYAGAVPPGPSDFPVSVRQHAYQSYVAYSPDYDRLAVATRHADYLELYSGRGAPLRVIQGPGFFAPIFDWRMAGDRPSMTSGDDLRFGYIAVASGNDSIYALYSGDTRGERPGEANYGQYIHVFDWDGELERVYRTDRRLIALAVDEEAGLLYAAAHAPEPAVVAYSIAP